MSKMQSYRLTQRDVDEAISSLTSKNHMLLAHTERNMHPVHLLPSLAQVVITSNKKVNNRFYHLPNGLHLSLLHAI